MWKRFKWVIMCVLAILQRLKSVWKKTTLLRALKTNPCDFGNPKDCRANEIEIVDRVYEALKHIQAISPNYEIRPF